jgi:hypothetical protein
MMSAARIPCAPAAHVRAVAGIEQPSTLSVTQAPGGSSDAGKLCPPKHVPLIPAQAGIQSQTRRSERIALGPRFRGDERGLTLIQSHRNMLGARLRILTKRVRSNFIDDVAATLEQITLVYVQFEMTCWFEPPLRRGLPTPLRIMEAAIMRPPPALPSSPRPQQWCGACRAAGSRRTAAPGAWSGGCPRSPDRIAASGGHRRARAAWHAH